jgi:hypothetical protein
MSTRRLLLTALTLVLAGAGALAAPSATAGSSPAHRASISISVTQPEIVVGQKSVVKGHVRPAKASTRVMLQQKVSGGWKNLRRKGVTATGGYRFTVAPKTGGLTRYRVIRLPWRPTGTLSSRTVAVRAYRWIDVTTTLTSWLDWDGVTSFGEPADIDGATYPDSIVIDATQLEGQGGYVEIDLGGHHCAAFDATIGALDDNAQGSEIISRVKLNGGLLRQDSWGVGDSDHLTLDVRDVTLLRVEAFVVDDELAAYFGIGTPRVLCAT